MGDPRGINPAPATQIELSPVVPNEQVASVQADVRAAMKPHIKAWADAVIREADMFNGFMREINPETGKPYGQSEIRHLPDDKQALLDKERERSKGTIDAAEKAADVALAARGYVDPLKDDQSASVPKPTNGVSATEIKRITRNMDMDQAIGREQMWSNIIPGAMPHNPLLLPPPESGGQKAQEPRAPALKF